MNRAHALSGPDTADWVAGDQDAFEALLRPAEIVRRFDTTRTALARRRWEGKPPRYVHLSRVTIRYRFSDVITCLPPREPALPDDSPPALGAADPLATMDDRLIPFDDAALHLAVSTDSIRRWYRIGRLRGVRMRRLAGGRRTKRCVLHVSAAAIAELARGGSI